MNIDFFKRLLLFLALLLVQVLVLNNIHLFDCATPLLYVYFVVSFQRGYPVGLSCCIVFSWAFVWTFLPTRLVSLLPR